MKQKTIYFTKPYVAELVETDIPKPAKGKVLVRLVYSTISSGTERANFIGDENVSPSGKKVKFPRVLGYSSSGIVEEVGEEVSSVKPGDAVAVSWGIHSQYVCVEEKNVYKLEENTSLSEAALWHITSFPMLAIRKCGLELGEPAIVMGLGVLGMMAVKLMRISGAAPVIVADPIKEKRELALKIGADYAFDPFSESFAKDVKRVSSGGVKVALEITGNGQSMDMVLDCMAKFGRVALLGCTRNSDFTIDYYKKVHAPGITLIGAHTLSRPVCESSPNFWTTRDDVLAVQKLVELGRLEFGSMVSEIHSPNDAGEVYSRLGSEPGFPLVQFDWRMLCEK